jgi:hypothetical protein
MRILIFLLVSSFMIPSSARAQPAVSTDAILKEAGKVAAKEGKNVFILFHASWCGWCHKMDSAMNDPLIRKHFDDNYVIRHLVVYESKGKEQLETPGGLDLLTKYKGNDQGIPYWLIFDNNGKLLADSKIRVQGGGLESGENSGCPATAKEVDHFVKVLKETSSLKETELSIIKKRFRENETQ